MVGVLADVVGFGDEGEDFVDEEGGVVGGHVVVFVAAVEARLGVFVGSGDDAGVDEEPDGGWHFAFGDEVIEDDGGFAGSAFVDVGAAVEEDHEGGGFGGVVVGGGVDPVAVGCAGVGFGGFEFV